LSVILKVGGTAPVNFCIFCTQSGRARQLAHRSRTDRAPIAHRSLAHRPPGCPMGYGSCTQSLTADFRPSLPARFSRYDTVAGSGRFKTVYRAFDETRGVDVAWSKILADDNDLTPEQMNKVRDELANGLHLDHPHVIKMYRCWSDDEHRCINSVTEFFTSGNLRDYSQKHKKTLDIKAVKKWGRQILQGLAFLHQQDPPIVHGDLRTDKIYINGYNGEIKIGDLGLEELVPRRFAPGMMPEGEPVGNQYTPSVDVFAFGLVMLELITRKVPDRTSDAWHSLAEHIEDREAREFISQCLAKSDERLSVSELLKHPFLVTAVRKTTTTEGEDGAPFRGTSDAHPGVATHMSESKDDDPQLDAAFEQLARLSPVRDGAEGKHVTKSNLNEAAHRHEVCEAGNIRGEEYEFEFSGRIRDGKLHVRLHMEYDGDDAEENENCSSKTIDFIYDPEVDTPDEVAEEISSEFNLSTTDQEICAAALKEWLADQAPGGEDDDA
jgi:WNK lysine deficient protein kinase